MATNIDRMLEPIQPEDITDPDAYEVIEIPEDETDEALVILDGVMLMDEEVPFDANLAEYIPDDILAAVGGELVAEVEQDITDREPWLRTFIDGVELLGLKLEDRTEPWEGACGIHHPILVEALLKFQSETIVSTFPAQGPVKTTIIGEETPETKDAAKRVRADMNYRLTEEMGEYRPEHERMLWGLGLSGNAFKKVYYSPQLRRQVATYVPAEDMIVPYGASTLTTAERVTHQMRKTQNEVRSLQQMRFYRDIELGEPSSRVDELENKVAEYMGFEVTDDDRYRLLEIHCLYDLPGFEDVDENGEETGIGLPYIITVDRDSGQVLAIRRNWREEDPARRPRQHFAHYSYVPGFGFYAFGLVHLLGAFAKGGTAVLRQLVDAGTLANLPAGFKANGMRVKNSDQPLAPGEFRDVDVASGTIRDNLVHLDFRGPNATLFQLLGHIEDTGRRFASIADMKVSDMSAESPVGTTLALLERQLKVMTAVQARIHHAMRQELRMLKVVIRDHTADEYEYTPDGAKREAKGEDYDLVNILPVSDPNAATMSQRVVQYQAVMQMAAQAPDIYDQPELHRRMLDVMDVKDIDKLIPGEDDLVPMDPISENMAILTNKPVKAFLYQDHEAHIAAHMTATQDPKIQQLVGQSPNAQQIMAAAQAHVVEHIAFAYRQRIEREMGVPLPPVGEPLPEDVEVNLSRTVAQAAARVLGRSKKEAEMEENEKLQDDPIVQMQQRELAIKEAKQRLQEREQQMKELKVKIDAAKDADKHTLEQQRLAVDAAYKADQLELQRLEQGNSYTLRSAQTSAQILGDAERRETEEARALADIMLRMTERRQNQQPQGQNPGQSAPGNPQNGQNGNPGGEQ